MEMKETKRPVGIMGKGLGIVTGLTGGFLTFAGVLGITHGWQMGAVFLGVGGLMVLLAIAARAQAKEERKKIEKEQAKKAFHV